MHTHALFLFEWLLIAVAILSLLAYLYGVRRQVRRGRYWSPWRSLAFAGGTALIVVGLHPTVAAFAHGDLRGHMAQHLLLGMFAPLGLVLAAPVSLLLRNLPTKPARRVVAFLRSAFFTAITRPAAALMLNLGAMYVLYLTPLYALSLSNSWLHGWLHFHFIAAGCLFTWVIAGPDPGPRRPSRKLRLLVLFLSMAGHALLAKMMYAYEWPPGTPHELDEIRAAAKLMYYGGDLAEVLLLIALLMSGRRTGGEPWLFGNARSTPVSSGLRRGSG